jgi:hypothetical protein
MSRRCSCTGEFVGTESDNAGVEVERVAREENKFVLVLDTVAGGDAERLYERTGWKRVGEVPNYALMPSGELCGTTFYCKQL